MNSIFYPVVLPANGLNILYMRTAEDTYLYKITYMQGVTCRQRQTKITAHIKVPPKKVIKNHHKGPTDISLFRIKERDVRPCQQENKHWKGDLMLGLILHCCFIKSFHYSFISTTFQTANLNRPFGIDVSVCQCVLSFVCPSVRSCMSS